MRIQDVLRLVVGLVFLATLPTGSAQRANDPCVLDEDCGDVKCCKADNTCSRRAAGSVSGGKRTDDACECAADTYNNFSKRCGCSADSHCKGNRCCTAAGRCSSRPQATIHPGRLADDACECTSGGYSEATGRCMCNDANPDCLPPTCCKANDLCSTRPRASVLADSRAGDSCECSSGLYDTDTRTCLCKDDDDCPGTKCCTEDGTCSKRDMESVIAGKRPNSACECVSRAIVPSTGRCSCADDHQCKDDMCCRASGICSSRARGSILPGKVARDECECATPVYHTDTKRCGCDADIQCPDNKCCLVNGTCSSKARGSILPGKVARDECECATRIYDIETQRCGCTEIVHCEHKPKKKACSMTTNVCVVGAIGDPHMTGFSGQKFDFTGKDGGWYALVSEWPSMQLNMRVTVPVPSMPKTTYITGFSLLTTDDNGHDHSIVVAVKAPHNVETACPAAVSPCLADGALTVLLDGEEALVAPGTVSLAPGIDITAVNTPGECRSFGFEAYWANKKQENAAYWARKEQEDTQDSRKLTATLSMGEWILANPTATNMADCTEYVARSAVVDGGLFAHQSEHSSFRIVTPATNIRLSHGKRYELAVRDPTDTIDLPDRVTWQMNIAIDHTDISNDARGILGETMVPTRDADGNTIMHGVGCIRGQQADYAVDGPLGTTFSMDSSGTTLQDATGGTFQ